MTSLLLKLDKDSSILIDCGESTVSQLLRFFGKDKLYEELTKIKVFYLSHGHLDHCNGSYGFIMKRANAFKHLNKPYEKLTIMFPKNFVEYHLDIIENICNQNIYELLNFLPNEMFYENFITKKIKLDKTDKIVKVGQKYLIEEFEHFERWDLVDGLKKKLNLRSLKTIRVEHIPYSCGLCIEMFDSDGEPFKLVFSGDCRPSDELCRIGKNCDLLIHESTFDNSRSRDAVINNHSTIGKSLFIFNLKNISNQNIFYCRLKEKL